MLPDIHAFPADVAGWLARIGRPFRAFEGHDSHCTSVGVEVGGARWFVKYSDHAAGMASLRRAVQIGNEVRHRVLVPLRGAVDRGDRVLLVYPFVDGEPVRREEDDRRPNPFYALPLADRARVLLDVIDLHVQLADQGFVAVDLYDGCFMYDYDRRRVWVYDLDEYRPEPFDLAEDRTPGSTRFMAPEEFVRGARIDEITNVFSLGRTAMVLLGDRQGRPSAWSGPPEALRVAERAASPDRNDRYGSVRAFAEAFGSAIGEAG